ncbi:MAG TPA: FAD-dependent oxidoreductase [Pseudolysinimonas sp.]|nr:FAD-dependent oxidoreductase [Pseudolysinimonas sp.]
MADHASLWQQGAPPIMSDPFPGDDRVHDLVVIGAGITGLTAGVLFARAGQDVVVVEAREAGAATTGHTTAKVSQLQGTMLQRIRGRNTAATLAAYVESQAAAFDWLAGFAAVTGVPFERGAAYSYAARPEGREKVETEHRLARAHGLETELVPDAGLPFPTHGAVRLADQGQIDPLLLVAALAVELRAHGGALVTGARVGAVGAPRFGDHAVVRTTSGVLRARRVVLATGSPILDRGLYFAKVSAHRSYAQAWRTREVPDGMFLGVEQPARSVREARGLLLTGGNGHSVGRHPSPRRAADELAEWTRRWWPDAEPVAQWSAQDHLSPHGVPFVGWLPRGGGKVYLATGFSKWGMTNGVATALTLVGDILGDGARWQRTLHRRPTLPAAAAVVIGENLAVGRWYARSWVRALTHPAPGSTLEGHGEVGRRGLVPTGVSTLDGVTTSVCAVCPHLGAVVQWNDFERSWDCPAHGSRFSADGTLLEGPATRGLART